MVIQHSLDRNAKLQATSTSQRSEIEDMFSDIKSGSVPPVASWIITRQCNLKCPHCYPEANILNKAELKSELSQEEHFEIVRRFAEAGVKCVILSGGEVLLLPHIVDLVASVSNAGMLPGICTNGLRVTPEITSKFKEAGLGFASISVDGADAQTHDTFRQCKGAYDKAIQAIRIMSSEGITVWADYTATAANKTNMTKLKEVVKEAGATYLNVKRFRPQGRGKGNASQLNLSLLEYKDIMLEYSSFGDYGPAFACTDDPMVYAYLRHTKNPNWPNEKTITSIKGCGAALVWFGVMPTGDISPCPLLDLTIGNVLRDDLVDLFKNAVKDILDRSHRTGACGICPEKDICGGCRAHAQAVSGNYLAEDPYCLLTLR
ncbi:Radical SAM domain heme biosynthesis protein [Methanosarcina sp. Kolksee]|uniref:radical SAM/SPASM domain-containing protein n=1 Tax=Methanosarcina sp. Kolksee TaxID=1434099 RepID=UPI000615A75A|nr:radical SAM protein [Methanosarcina sp. Kolksee]AKB47810.1 Radical SAM domain heme biosynthesis protein [Methanosarcina sp. Kolksee]